MDGPAERAKREATVIRISGPTTVVRIDREDLRANLRGLLKAGPRRATHPVATGDRVIVGFDASGGAVIEEVLPRRNLIARIDPGDHRRCHGIAANIDQLLCVQSVRLPRLNLRAVDRFLLLAEAAGVPSLLVVNKFDLLKGDPPPELDHYEQIGVRVLRTSTHDRRGIEPFREVLVGKVTVLIGPSGVGKSSLLNAAVPGIHLRTRAVSQATSKGVHTTVRVEWIDLPGTGAVLDTPGLRAIQPWGITPSDLADLFPEFRAIAGCRFEDCLHRSEPGCMVRRSAERGNVPAFRYDSYLRILSSMEDQRDV